MDANSEEPFKAVCNQIYRLFDEVKERDDAFLRRSKNTYLKSLQEQKESFEKVAGDFIVNIHEGLLKRFKAMGIDSQDPGGDSQARGLGPGGGVGPVARAVGGATITKEKLNEVGDWLLLE